MQSTFKQDTPRFTTIRRWLRQTSRHWRESPFLDICLDEDEAHLAEVDVHFTGAGRADRGEEVRVFQGMCYVFEFAAIAGEEDCPRTRAVADADDVADDVGRAVGGGGREGLVEAAVARGEVGDGCFVEACDYSVSRVT